LRSREAGEENDEGEGVVEVAERVDEGRVSGSTTNTMRPNCRT
jgi:hypothetical protein